MEIKTTTRKSKLLLEETAAVRNRSNTFTIIIGVDLTCQNENDKSSTVD